MTSRAQDTPAQLLGQARQQLQAGNLTQARTLLQRAYTAAPADLRIKLAFGSVAPTEELAIELLSAVSRDTLATRSQQAKANLLMGDLYFLKKDYQQAGHYYGQAYSLSGRPEDALRQGLAVMLAGKQAKADTVLSAVEDKADPGSAAYHRALHALHARDYTEALELFKTSVDTSDTSAPWFPGAMAGRAICADRLGYVGLAAQYRTSFETRFPDALEKRLFGHGFVPLPGEGRQYEPESRPDPLPRKASPTPQPASVDGETFTIQVGSFATMENARRLQNKMKERFGTVRIVSATVNGTQYHRVRIGSFPDRDAAESFAERMVSGAGVSYKVLKE